MNLNTRIFPTTGYARVLLFMFITRELGGTGTGCLFLSLHTVVQIDTFIYAHAIMPIIHNITKSYLWHYVLKEDEHSGWIPIFN